MSIQYIHSGVAIKCDGEGQPVGTLGLLTKREESDGVLALCASQIIRTGATVLGDLGSDKFEGIGQVNRDVEIASVYNSSPTIDSLIALFTIRSERPVSPNTTKCLPTTNIVAPDDSLGEIVTKFGARSGITYGRVMSAQSNVRIRSSATGIVTTFGNAVEVHSAGTSDLPFAIRGDSGALVLTESDEILGIVIGGNERKCFVAPLYEFLKRESLFPLQHYTAVDAKQIIYSSKVLTDFIANCSSSSEHWQSIVATSRLALHAEFEGLMYGSSGDREDKRNTMEAVQDQLARILVEKIGPRNLLNGIVKLSYLKNGIDADASDNWLLRSLVERQHIVRVSGSDTHVYLALGEEVVAFERSLLTRTVTVARANPRRVFANRDIDDSTDNKDLANQVLGSTHLPYSIHI